MPRNYPPAFMTLSTLCEHLDLGERSVEELVRTGVLPRPLARRGKRLWVWRDCEQALLKLRQERDEEEAAARMRTTIQKMVGR
jgi:hypothetical protein